MKKTLIAYAVILAGIFITLSSLDSQSDYAIEQKVWKVHKQYFDIIKDPNVIPEQTFEDVIAGYQKIIDKYPQSRLTEGLRFLVGRVYFLKKDYETARKKFYEIIEIYPQKKELHAEAMAAVAKTYEVQDNWPQAYKIYDQILKSYPLTPAALGIPIYIANYHKSLNDYQQTVDAYEKAIVYYRKIASENPASPAGYNALRYLSNCYLDQKHWTEAINTLGEILQKYAHGEYMTAKTADTIIKTINIVSTYQLKDYDAAVHIYRGIIEQNPGHPLNAHFQKMIDAFNQLKEKGVQVTPAK